MICIEDVRYFDFERSDVDWFDSNIGRKPMCMAHNTVIAIHQIIPMASIAEDGYFEDENFDL